MAGETEPENFEEEAEPLEESEELTEEEQAEIDDGEVCANCGSEFREHQGEAALCTSCWDAADEAGRAGFVRSNSTVVSE